MMVLSFHTASDQWCSSKDEQVLDDGSLILIYY